MDAIVETYLKIGDEFIPIADCSGPLPDEFYIDGAIRCEIGGQQILGDEQWDLVDQLWCYLVEGIAKLSRNETFESYFPDQPLRLRLEPVSEYCVKVTIGQTSYRVDRETFVNAMKDGAAEFFAAIKKLCPSSADTWDRYFRVVRSIKR